MRRINVSSLHLCHRCPRLLAYELRGDKDAWRVGLSGSGSFPGRLFHDEIAAPFHRAMACGSDSSVIKEFLAALSGPQNAFEMALQGLLEWHYFLPVMERHGARLDAGQVLQLGYGFQRWVCQLTAFIDQTLFTKKGKPEDRLKSCLKTSRAQAEPGARGRKTAVYEEVHENFEPECNKVMPTAKPSARQGGRRPVPGGTHDSAAVFKQLLKQVFHDPEQLVTGNYELRSGQKIQVSGKYDALLFDLNAREAVLMEFKGRKASHADEDFLQLVLYSWLVRETTGITPRGVVFYLEEDEPEVGYSADAITSAMPNLPNLFNQVVEVIEVTVKNKGQTLPFTADPGLCQVCKHDSRCDEDWGVRKKGMVTPPADEASEKLSEKGRERASAGGARNAERRSDRRSPASTGRYASSAGTGAYTAVCEDSEHRANSDHARAAAFQTVSEEASQRMEALIRTLKSLKLPIKPAGLVAGPRFIRLKIEPCLEQGVTVKKLCNQATNLQVALRLNAPPLIQPQAGYVSVDVPREVRVPLTLGEVWRKGQRNRPSSPVAFPIGMAIDGSIVWADLSDSTMTSILVGGTAGSGKSVFLRSAVIGLALNATPQDVRVTLIDPKRVTFTDLAALPYLASPVLMDYLAAMARLEALVEEMERRYHLFEKQRVPDINACKLLGEPMNHQVVLIDEYADLMVDKKARESLEACVVRLAQKGRAAGMHLILATQRPDAKVVTPLIKANLQLKVALKVTTATNSRVILDEAGAECLIGNGDMLIGGSLSLQRVQGPLLSQTEIEEVVQKSRCPG